MNNGPDSIRLRLYEGLGVEPIADKNGVITKMIVREYLHLSWYDYHLTMHQGQDLAMFIASNWITESHHTKQQNYYGVFLLHDVTSHCVQSHLKTLSSKVVLVPKRTCRIVRYLINGIIHVEFMAKYQTMAYN